MPGLRYCLPNQEFALSPARVPPLTLSLPWRRLHLPGQSSRCARPEARGLQTVILRAGVIGSPLRSAWGDVIVARMRGNGWPARWHPQDNVPWVYTDDLAELTYLAATHPKAPGQAFVAVDANAVIADLRGRIAQATACAIASPGLAPRMSRTKIGKIREFLDYRPRHTLEHTVATLVCKIRSGIPVR
jgi:nucleoside-diphosphate-sugar epimerase